MVATETRAWSWHNAPDHVKQCIMTCMGDDLEDASQSKGGPLIVIGPLPSAVIDRLNKTHDKHGALPYGMGTLTVWFDEVGITL